MVQVRLQTHVQAALRLVQLGMRSRRVALMVERVLRERLTYLDREALVDLGNATLDAERAGLDGELVEAGCALGGSALVIAAAKRPERDFAIFDVFGTIPPPSEEDGADVRERYAIITSGEAQGIGKNVYYGYQPNLREQVERTFAAHGLAIAANAVRLVPGLFQNTLPRERAQVALAHVDGDWYASVRVCLESIVPRLVPGGRIIVDDYDAWSGCRRAVDEFRGSAAGAALRTERHARLHLVLLP